MSNSFFDGVKSMVSAIINRRNITAQNAIESVRLSDTALREIYRHGIANKIVRLKAGHALKDTLQFDSKEDETFYDRRLAKKVKQAAKWMLAFGRGVIVIHRRGDDLSAPLNVSDAASMMLSVFSGDMVTTGIVDFNLQSLRYYKPQMYTIRGTPIHWTRVVDFTYVEPVETEAAYYRYGGISEFELIYEQLLADGLVQRASPKIIEKASTIFYKVEGFKDAVKTGRESQMVEYFSRMEDIRGLHSSGLVDKEDDIEVISQTISNLSEADQITLRRLAMVTGIPLALLVGENVKGLNSTGDNERAAFQDMIEALQSDYLLDPINDLMRRMKQGEVWFKENQGETATDRIEYESKAIDNAVKLWQLGEDYATYLNDKNIIQKDEFSTIFTDEGLGDETTDSD